MRAPETEGRRTGGAQERGSRHSGSDRVPSLGSNPGSSCGKLTTVLDPGFLIYKMRIMEHSSEAVMQINGVETCKEAWHMAISP